MTEETSELKVAVEPQPFDDKSKNTELPDGIQSLVLEDDGPWEFPATHGNITHSKGEAIPQLNPDWWYDSGGSMHGWTCMGPYMTLAAGKYRATWEYFLFDADVFRSPGHYAMGGRIIMEGWAGLATVKLFGRFGVGPQAVNFRETIDSNGQYHGQLSREFSINETYANCEFYFANDGPWSLINGPHWPMHKQLKCCAKKLIIEQV